MSQSSPISISCPACGHVQEFTSWHSINVSLDPDKKTELKNGRLTRFTCEQCDHQSEINYPMLYHDPRQQIMIWMRNDDQGGDTDLSNFMVGDFINRYRLRLVRSRNQLIEKTHVFDQGLDDRLLELFKVVVRSNNKSVPEGDLLFAGVGTGASDTEEFQFAVVSETDTKFIGTSRQAFEDFAEQLSPIALAEPLAAGKWHRIDEAYATDLLARHLPDSPT